MRFYENPMFLNENRLPQRSYYIPKNDGAYKLLKGGALFVKEGGILVTMKPQKYILEKQHDYIIDVYPSQNKEATFTLFEDDGFTYGYEKGFGCFTKIETEKISEKGFDLVIHPRTGSFPGRPDNGHDIMKNSVPKIASE